MVRPYLAVHTEPLMGHTWDSYYYHHVKHHHVEGNGPDDLSSTIRYQRDEPSHFLMYVGRFIAFIWIELPLYFLRKNKPALALKAGVSEMVSYLFIYLLARTSFYPTLFILIIPLFLMRIGLMVGNYGQHALVDDVDPASDFRSSITLIDVPVCRTPLPDPLSKIPADLLLTEQPPLLQRRLAYLPPSQSLTPLEGSSASFSQGKEGIHQRTSACFPEH